MSEDERRELESIRNHKRSKASNITRAIALLMADEGASGPKLTDAQIHVATGFSSRTLERLRKRCCEAGPLGALERKPRETPGREIKITGDVEARIIQLACSAPPAGRAQWTTRLLAGHLVEIEIIDSISHQSVATVLKRSELKPWQQDCWCIPPKQNSAFVAAMEDVLEVYARPPRDDIPLVCLDEFAKQLLSETRTPVPAAPGQPARYDYEYVREGSVSGFMMGMPHLGKREVFIGADGRRTAKDFALCLEYLSDTLLPDARKIVLVMDNLNTHKEASLYETFPPEQARALCEKFEIHYTPKHGSWLNMAEIEIGILGKQCLARRIGSEKELRSEVKAYLDRKNANSKPISWQFTNAEARVKLKSLYPPI